MKRITHWAVALLAVWTAGVGGGIGGLAPGELEMSTNVQVTFAVRGP